MKNFGDIKNIRRFAANSILKGGTTRHKLTGIFCTFLLINFGFACPINSRVNSLVGCKDMGIAKPLNTTVSTPVWSVNAPTAFEVEFNGKAEPFLFSVKQTNSTVMNSTEKNLQGAKHSSPSARKLTKKQLIQELNQSRDNERNEKDAKNQAYAYILSEGKFYGFADFCREHPGTDWHAACVTGLLIGMLGT